LTATAVRTATLHRARAVYLDAATSSALLKPQAEVAVAPRTRSGIGRRELISDTRHGFARAGDPFIKGGTVDVPVFT